MRPRNYFILFVFYILNWASYGLAANIRLSWGGGFSSVQTKNEITQSEGPFNQLYSLDSLLDSKNMIGVEHIRTVSLSPMSTAISFTGLLYKYYINNAPGPFWEVSAMPTSQIVYRDLAVYVGGGIGFAQSALPPDENDKISNAAGIYLNPRVGADLQLTPRWGIRGELIFFTTIYGKGSIGGAGIIGSLSYNL